MFKDLTGRVVADRFEILSPIGKGGMGAVYKARQTALDRIVALKVIRPELLAKGKNVQRFLREAAACAKMSHGNIVRIHDFGQEPDLLLWIAMENLEGQSLWQMMQAEGKQHCARVVHIGEQTADALQHAHEAGVIHRDIKPGNVMLVKQGEDQDYVKVVDFGLVQPMEPEGEGRLTTAGIVMGSPAYMSPEQLQLVDLDGRSDLFPLGMLMYEMLAGQLPYNYEAATKLMDANLNKLPPRFRDLDPPVDVPADVEAIVMQLLEKDPNDRPESAAAAAKILHRLARKLGGTMVLRAAQGVPSGETAELLATPDFESDDVAESDGSQLPWMLVGALSVLVVLVGVVMFIAGLAM